MVTDENHMPQARVAVRSAIDKALNSTGKAMEEKVESSILAAEDALGRPQIPNAPSTVARKGFNHPLVETGSLATSFESEVNTRKRELEFFSENENVARHEYGGANYPPRPMMQPAAIWAEQELVDDVFSDHLEDELKRVEL